MPSLKPKQAGLDGDILYCWNDHGHGLLKRLLYLGAHFALRVALWHFIDDEVYIGYADALGNFDQHRRALIMLIVQQHDNAKAVCEGNVRQRTRFNPRGIINHDHIRAVGRFYLADYF